MTKKGRQLYFSAALYCFELNIPDTQHCLKQNKVPNKKILWSMTFRMM
jgi:hypothetical protein